MDELLSLYGRGAFNSAIAEGDVQAIYDY